MKCIAPLILLLIGSASCSKERHITRQTLKRQEAVMALAKKIFGHYSQHTDLTSDNLDTLGFISDAEFGLLRDKLKCSDVEVVHVGGPTFNVPVDSLVIFTRSGFPLKQYNIMVDVRQNPRDSVPMPVDANRHYRIAVGIYYFESELSIS